MIKYQLEWVIFIRDLGAISMFSGFRNFLFDRFIYKNQEI